MYLVQAEVLLMREKVCAAAEERAHFHHLRAIAHAKAEYR